MRLRITDYGKNLELQEAIWGLWVNLHHLMSSTNIYKIYESESIEFYKAAIPQPSAPPQQQQGAGGPGNVMVDVRCDKCGATHRLQANFGAPQPLQQGAAPFPKDCMFICKNCRAVLNLMALKLQIESQIHRPIILA